MMSFITILLIGISLSMDAFSLSLAYGMSGMNSKKKLLLALTVGIYHFIMPLIGLTIGMYIDNITFINLHIIASIILVYIGIDLIVSNAKEEKKLIIDTLGIFLFGISVSIDSLSVGIGLKTITNNYLLASTIFSVCSATFTYIGLILGNIIGNKIGTYSKIMGGVTLIIIAILIYIK